MIPFKEVNVLDINAAHLGVPTIQLMENAGRHVAKTAESEFEIKGKKVAIVCGPGNNGGDGYVAARYLSGTCEVTVFLVKSAENIRSEISRTNFAKIKDNVQIMDAADLGGDKPDFSLIIDSILGIGTFGEIREPYQTIINKINEMDIPVLSVDVPSGLGNEDAVKPSLTVTFHDIKEGMTKENSGEIIVVDIGIPKDAGKYLGPGEFVYYTKPDSKSHKGDNGRLLIIGGGPYSGAPALSGLAAYRTGVDLVHIATPKKTYQPIASFSPNFIVHSLGRDFLAKEDLEIINAIIDKIDAVIIGPGLGEHPDTHNAILEFIRTCNKPLVIDADAIKAVSQNIEVLNGRSGVITPHLGEFELLYGEKVDQEIDTRAEQVRALSEKLDITILLKGEIDILSDGTYIKFNRTGNPAMTVGGTGDVLAGLVGGLLAKGISPFHASRIGAFTNGTSGDLTFKELGYSLMATDIIERIPHVLKSYIR